MVIRTKGLSDNTILLLDILQDSLTAFFAYLHSEDSIGKGSSMPVRSFWAWGFERDEPVYSDMRRESEVDP